MAGALWIYGVGWLLLLGTLAVHRSNGVMLGVAVVMFAATPVLFGAIVWGLIADKARTTEGRTPRERYRLTVRRSGLRPRTVNIAFLGALVVVALDLLVTVALVA